jgi:hypothetical protein
MHYAWTELSWCCIVWSSTDPSLPNSWWNSPYIKPTKCFCLSFDFLLNWEEFGPITGSTCLHMYPMMRTWFPYLSLKVLLKRPGSNFASLIKSSINLPSCHLYNILAFDGHMKKNLQASSPHLIFIINSRCHIAQYINAIEWSVLLCTMQML